MSCGFLMFAYDSGPFKYGRMAMANAALIKKNCKNPNIALVTDSRTMSDLKKNYSQHVWMFDHVLIDKIDRTVPNRAFYDTRYNVMETPYLNSNRSSAFDFSPFDETILVDVDYLMLDDTMDLAWGSKEDILCNKRLVDVTKRQVHVERFHDMGIPTYWATALYFKKTDRASILFDHMRFIKEHYDYYMSMYGFNHGPYFRNDFALSISLHEMNGFVEEDAVASLPIDYILIGDSFDNIHKVYEDGSLLVTSEGVQGDYVPHRISRNLHIMNKKALLRNCDGIINAATS